MQDFLDHHTAALRGFESGGLRKEFDQVIERSGF